MSSPAIVDTHVHLWDPQRLSYPWLDSVPLINRPHLPENYDLETGEITVEHMVFVQCGAADDQSQAECDWVESLARLDGRIQAIIPAAPIERGAKARSALARLAQNPRVKGVRRLLQGEADPRFCLQPSFIEGIELLADFDLSFDICVRGDEQMATVLELVQRCPGVSFILDHMGKPRIREGLLEPWATHLRSLAELPNCWCKISGLVTEAELDGWTPEDLQPYLEVAFAAFGEERVCFGGDWPVCKLSGGWRRWYDMLADYTEDWPAPRRQKLFRDNAIAFYRLG